MGLRLSARAKVLVISDDRALRERVRTGVFALGALPILTGDPGQAVQIAVDVQPSAAIIDGQLVRTDDRVRPASLRRVGSLSDAPFMVIAARTRRAGLVRLGDDDVTVLERDLDTGSMAARLRSWLRASEHVPSSPAGWTGAPGA